MVTLGLIASLGTLGNAHATWTTNIDYVRAANLPPPDGTRRVLLLDLAARNARGNDLIIVDRAVSAFREKARSNEAFELVFVPTQNNPDLSVDPSWEELAKLAKQNQAQAIISFDSLSYELGQYQHDLVDVTNTVNGVQVVENRHRVSRSVKGNLGIRYMDPFNRVMLFDDTYYASRTASATSKARIRAREQVAPEVSKIKPGLAVSCANGFANEVFAVRIKGRRSFFANGKLKEGRRYAEVGKWVDARKAWKEHWNAGGKRGMKAQYNVALTFEVMGRPDKALETLDPIVGRWNKDIVKSYYRQLKARVDNERRLEDQGLK